MLRRFVLLLGIFLSFAAAAIAQPVVSFTAASYGVPERDRFATVHVQRSGDLNAAVSCSINVANVTNGTSFGLGTVIFAKGEADHQVVVSGDVANLDDKYWNNPPRRYRATIQSVSGGSVGTPSVADIDIIDDEQKPQVSVADVSVAEGNPGQTPARAVFTFRTTTPFPSFKYIAFSVHDGTAKKGLDYNWSPTGVVVAPFNPDQTTFNLYIEIIPDREPEGDETFTIQLEPAPDYVVANPIGTGTIIDDDGAVTPLAQRLARGGKGVIHISVGDPAPAPESVQLLALEPFLTVPSSVTIPAGGNSADAEIGATGTGGGTVFVTLPPQRGGRVYACSVTVFEPVTVTFDPLVLSLPVGASATVKAKLDPPPFAAATLKLTQTAASIADLPSSAIADTSGNAAIPVHALAAGATTVSLALPDPMGDASGKPTADFVVVVSVPTGLTITSLSQKTGRTSGGETVKLFGTNFNGPCAVTFGGIPSQSSDTPANGGINAVTPPHDAGVVDVGIRCGGNTYVSAGAFTYTAAPLSATELSPAAGSTRGGTIVVVRGANLRTGLCTARFGNAVAHTLAWNGNASITVAAPPHSSGTVPVTLTCGSDTATLTPGFNYIDADDAAPSISSALPVRAAPGDHVTISGARFRSDDAIFFDTAAAADAAAVTTGVHVVVVPEMPAGTVSVSLRDIAGRTTAGPKIEIIAPPAPTITQIAARLTTGAEFTVAGTGFRRGLTFALGPAILQPLSITTTRAVFRAPTSLAAGPASFTISERGTTLVSRPVDLTTTGLNVASIAPPCAVREGGAPATISGSGFEDGAMVQFGTTYAAGVVFRDRFTLTATVPPAFASSGDATITVTNPDGTAATLTNAFAYRSAAEGGCVSRRRGAGH